jgi:hypothetical protein
MRVCGIRSCGAQVSGKNAESWPYLEGVDPALDQLVAQGGEEVDDGLRGTNQQSISPALTEMPSSYMQHPVIHYIIIIIIVSETHLSVPGELLPRLLEVGEGASRAEEREEVHREQALQTRGRHIGEKVLGQPVPQITEVVLPRGKS